ncbi:Sm-like protein LSM8 [Striga hermonthica]|uniref:Sm-like protein LSM8 n=1 Tax=Striga hermonthica TaxID=68872 RepID=A0A9N7MKB5_STRHE|nr:Sm-like protein LSM8 [Striga hermonthica]
MDDGHLVRLFGAHHSRSNASGLVENTSLFDCFLASLIAGLFDAPSKMEKLDLAIIGILSFLLLIIRHARSKAAKKVRDMFERKEAVIGGRGSATGVQEAVNKTLEERDAVGSGRERVGGLTGESSDYSGCSGNQPPAGQQLLASGIGTRVCNFVKEGFRSFLVEVLVYLNIYIQDDDDAAAASEDKMATGAGLETLVDQTISIITNDGRNIVGVLKGFDQATNIILDESHERVYSTKEGVQQLVLGLYIIRGDNISIVGELDEELDASLDLSKLRAHPLKPVIH